MFLVYLILATICIMIPIIGFIIFLEVVIDYSVEKKKVKDLDIND